MTFSEAGLDVLGDLGNNRQVLELLSRSIDHLIPFVGAGLSVDFHYPTWENLLEKIARSVGLLAEISELLSRKQFEEVAERLVAHLPGAFEDTILLEFDERRVSRPLGKGAVRELPRIARGPVLTTNLDRVLEMAFDDAFLHFPEVVSGSRMREISRSIQFNDRFLWKLHGDYRDPASRVMTLTEYQHAYGASTPAELNLDQGIPAAISQVFGAHPVLFLGCSLRSDRTTLAIARVAARFPGTIHFALLPDTDNVPGRLAELYSWNIRPLFYPEGDYAKIEHFLAYIGDTLSFPSSASEGWRGPSIAVLPFRNVSGDKDDESFIHGLSEDVLNELAQIPSLRVTPVTSVRAVADMPISLQRKAEMLRVRTVLEGSVRRDASRVRITVQLVDAIENRVLWSEPYDRDMTNVFAIQKAIAFAIASVLKLQVERGPARTIRHTPSVEAYEAFRKGKHQLLKITPNGLTLAKTYYQQAIDYDPKYSEPYSDLGAYYFLLASLGQGRPSDLMPQVEYYARQALAITAPDPRAHALLGAVASIFRYDWTPAYVHFKQAMSSATFAFDVHWVFATCYLAPLGRFFEAAEQMKRTLAVDPINAIARGAAASYFNQAGRYDLASVEAREAITLDDKYSFGYFALAESYLGDRRFTEAIDAAEKACQLAPWSARYVGLLAGLYERRGDTMTSRRVLAPLTGATARYWKSIGMMLYYLTSSEPEAAACWFEAAIEERDLTAPIYAQGAFAMAIRSTGRWDKLSRMMRLASAP